MKRVFLLLIFIICGLFPFYSLLLPQAFALEDCRGIVSDKTTNTPIDGVTIKLFNNRQERDRTSTSNGGQYHFVTDLFAPGQTYATEKIEFEKAGYKLKVVNYRDPNNRRSCPGNIQLDPENVTPVVGSSFGCKVGVCEAVQPNASYNKVYSDASACSQDCAVYKLDYNSGTRAWTCKKDASGTYYSLADCNQQANQRQPTPAVSTSKFKYNPATNTCEPDSAGETWDECKKRILSVIATAQPLPPPCSEWRDQNHNVIPTQSVAVTDIKYCAKVTTGLGDISTHPFEFVRSFFGILLSISGGIALLLIIYSGYKLMISRGNPETIQAARETLTSAIVGLLFIIFSMVLLQLIGVDILHIPGLQ